VDGADVFISRIIDAQTVPAKMDAEDTKSADTMAHQKLPLWIENPPMEEPDPPKPLAPSKPDEEEPAVNSPRGTDDSWKFKRGNIIHRILQYVPDLPSSVWEKSIENYLKRGSLDLPVSSQKTFKTEIMAILNDDIFAPIFGPGSRAEVPLIGLIKGQGSPSKILSGQIDRLLVTDDAILIIDYKTNRPPPTRAEDIAVIYLKQLAAYKSVLQNIYGEKPIKCALLWTEKAELMAVSDKLLDPYML
jgi:ATP-dependent helicase/nuclease subunit A